MTVSRCDLFIEKISRILPELCSPKDLVKIGIYKTEMGAWHARKKGTSPEFFKLPEGHVLYPKESIIDFLKKAKSAAKND